MTKRTLPPSSVLANNVDPATRDYVDAVLREKFAEVDLVLGQLQEQVRSLTNRVSGWSGNVHARMNFLEKAINLTPASRRKMEQLVQLLEEGGE